MAWWHPRQRTSEEIPSLTDESRSHQEVSEPPKPVKYTGVPAWAAMERPTLASRTMPTVVQSMMQRTLASHAGAPQLLSTASPMGHEVHRDGGGLVTSLLRPITGVDLATTEFCAGSDLVLQRTTLAGALKTFTGNPDPVVTSKPRVLAGVASRSAEVSSAPPTDAQQPASEPVAVRPYSSAATSLISAPEINPYRVMAARTYALVSTPRPSLLDRLDDARQDTAGSQPVSVEPTLTAVPTVIGRTSEPRIGMGAPQAPTTAPAATPQRRPLAVEMPSLAKISRDIAKLPAGSPPATEVESSPLSLIAPRIRAIGLGAPILRLPDSARAMTSEFEGFDDVGTPYETLGLHSAASTTPFDRVLAGPSRLDAADLSSPLAGAPIDTPGLDSVALTTSVVGAPPATVRLSSAVPIRRLVDFMPPVDIATPATSGLRTAAALRRSPDLATFAGGAPSEGDAMGQPSLDRALPMGVHTTAVTTADDLILHSGINTAPSRGGELGDLVVAAVGTHATSTGDVAFAPHRNAFSSLATAPAFPLASTPAAMLGSRAMRRSVADVAPTVLSVEQGERSSVVALVRRSLAATQPILVKPSWGASGTGAEVASDGPNSRSTGSDADAIGAPWSFHSTRAHASTPEFRLAERVGPSTTTVLARTPTSHGESDYGIQPNPEVSTEFPGDNPGRVNRFLDSAVSASAPMSATNSSMFDSTEVQRQGESSSPAAPSVGPAVGAADLDALAHSLYERIRTRLRRELLDDRERAGFLLDRMR